MEPRQPTPDESRDEPLSPEEQEVARKAREEAARRQASRRNEVTDVAKFLSDILAPPPAEVRPESVEPVGPSLDFVLPGEAGREPGFAPEPSRPPPSADAGAPPAGFASPGAAAPAEFAAAASRRAEGAGGQPPLGPALAETLRRIRAAGAFRPGIRLEEDDEGAAPTFGRTMATLTSLHRRPPPALEFEPEEAAVAPVLQDAQRTMILGGARTAAPPAPYPSTGTAAPARQYSLDDLPTLGAAPPGPPPSGEDGAVPAEEPAMEDADLNAALAAAESAVGKGREGAAPPTAPLPAPEPSPEPVGEPVPTGPPPRSYTLDDLPEAPTASPARGAERSDETSSPDDRLAEHRLPDLSDLVVAAKADEPAGAGPPNAPQPTSTLERAIDRSVEPGRSQTGVLPQMLPAADDASQLSARQLADIERYLEREAEGPGSGEASAAARREPPRPHWLRLRLSAFLAALRKALLRIRAGIDRVLAPYCLSAKRVLGIAGIIALAVEMALIYRYWIEPIMRASGEGE